jgi:hypothetical protein
MLKVKEWINQRTNAQFKVLRMHGTQIEFVERLSDNLKFSRLITYNFIRGDLRYSVKFLIFHTNLTHVTYRITQYQDDTNEMLDDTVIRTKIEDLKYNADVSWHIKMLMEQSKKFEQVHSKK